MAGKTKKATGAKETKKMTAAQRITMLEQMVQQSESRFKAVGDELDTLRGLISSLAKRLNASIQATESDDAVKEIIITQNVQELQGKVDFLVNQGVLQKADDGYEAGEKSFLVGREVDSTGKVINPRIQFSLGSVLPELREKIKGQKVGGVVNPNEEENDTGISIEITELYQIVDPKVDKKFEGKDGQAEA
jgi:hypothetical protein